MSKFTTRLLRGSFLGGAAFGALTMAAGAAHAQERQDTPVPVTAVTQEDLENSTVEELAAAVQQGSSGGERVVVTGSRIARDQFSSSSPIQVITSEASILEGLVDTAELLQGSTTAAGSVQFNNQFGGFVIEGGPGINSVSLRGLGAQRSLVLVNGRRPGPAGSRGEVGSFDLNVIPDSIIDRVEILKDGASSIYGSDAVAGVANIITRSSVDRPELTVQYNMTEEGGGESLQVNGAWGHSWGTGDLMLAVEYEDREPLQVKDRSYLSCPQDFIYDPDTGERIDRLDRSATAGTALENCDQIYFNTVLAGIGRLVPSPDGVTIGPIPGYRPRANGTYAGGQQAFYEDILATERYGDSYVISDTQRASLYGKLDMTLGGSIDWRTEALYTQRETAVRRFRQFFPVIAPDFLYDVSGPFPSPFTTELVQPVTIWPSNDDVTVDYTYVTTGLAGDFGAADGLLSSWTWEANASWSQSDSSYTGNEIGYENAGDWRFPSADGLYHAPQYNPFDPAFLAGDYSQDVYDLITTMETGSTTYEQTVFDAIVTGDLFELPAGPFGFALGVEHRQFEIDDTPSQNSQDGVLWGTSTAQITAGEDKVTEAFTEVNIPILSGVTGFEELTLSGSARYFDYDSYGSDSVWKAGLNWQVVPSLRVRATKGTSYRAPALYELFLGNQTAFLSQLSIDPCIDWGNSSNENIRANCAADGIPANYTGGGGSSATIVSGGGFGVLEAETSDASTFGVIFTPTELALSVAIDYFDIVINDQVGQLSAAGILGGCYGAPNFPNNFCTLFDRDGVPSQPLAITEVRDSYLNINEQSTRGVDISVRYEHEFDFGDLAVDLNATRTLEDAINLFDASLESGFDTNRFNGTIGDPEWVADAQVALRRGDFTYSWFVDYVSATDNSPFANELFTYFGRDARRIITTDDYFAHDLSVRWLGDDYSITAGVANVFNAVPPVVSDGSGVNRLGNVALQGTQYDLRGRTFFVRLGARF